MFSWSGFQRKDKAFCCSLNDIQLLCFFFELNFDCKEHGFLVGFCGFWLASGREMDFSHQTVQTVNNKDLVRRTICEWNFEALLPPSTVNLE